MSEGGSCSRTWQTSTRLATELSFRRRRCWRRLGRNDPTAQLQPLLLPIALLRLQAAMSSKEMSTEVAVRQPRRRSSYGSRSPCHQGGKGSSIQIAAAPTTVTAFRGRRSGSTLVHPATSRTLRVAGSSDPAFSVYTIFGARSCRQDHRRALPQVWGMRVMPTSLLLHCLCCSAPLPGPLSTARSASTG